MNKDCEEFASEGLRTLVYGYRFIEAGAQENINALYERVEGMKDEEIERNFTIIGLTGFEDKLQEGVLDCLNSFSEAGIKTWIVTGDKGETARSIGYQCGVLSHSRKL